MKLTKKNLLTFKTEDGDTIADDVVDYVLDNWDDYEDKKAIFTDVLYHGCQSGIVGHLIYYTDTLAYAEAHKDEINELLKEALWNYGSTSLRDIFGDKYDTDDPLNIGTQNRNLFAWFGFEETMRNIARNFEELEDLI